MSSEKLESDLLLTRDRRQERLDSYLGHRYPATLFLSLNIPGALKNRPGTEALFSWALNRVTDTFPGATVLETERDLLGPYAALALTGEAGEAKQRLVALEESTPAARLVDLDLYDHRGRQIGRADLSLPPRSCLLCDRPATECMRTGRHTLAALTDKTDELLAPYRE